MAMVCARCHTTGIYWIHLRVMVEAPSTYCPNCGGRNCQMVEPETEDDPDGIEGADDAN
jgi:Zn finger protein HypA/HybF involved in hydrogenase expression